MIKSVYDTFKIILVLSALFLACETKEKSFSQSDALYSFAKLYGYVKYFHPSDEAQEIDWDKFAIYGSNKVRQCSSNEELIQTLNTLFRPIAPSIVISKEDPLTYDFKRLTPNDSGSSLYTYWQHEGLNLNMNISDGTYKSIRVNRKNCVDKSDPAGKLIYQYPINDFGGEKYKFTGLLNFRQDYFSSASVWVQPIASNKKNNYQNSKFFRYNDTNKWIDFELEGKLNDTDSHIILGVRLNGKGNLLIDNLKLAIFKHGKWIDMPIKNSNFEKTSAISNKEELDQFFGINKGYQYKIIERDLVVRMH